MLVEKLNKMRLDNKNKWVFFHSVIDNKEIFYKAYNTYIQVLKIDQIDHAGACDIKVSQFKAHLNNAFNYHNMKGAQ